MAPTHWVFALSWPGGTLSWDKDSSAEKYMLALTGRISLFTLFYRLSDTQADASLRMAQSE